MLSHGDHLVVSHSLEKPQVPPVSPMPGIVSLRIISNNDPHEKFKALPHLISAFQLMGNEAENAGRDVLKLNSGDNNVGKELEDWALQVQLLNMMNYNGSTLGNHELDLGSANYAKGLQGATFPTLVSNLKIPPNSSMAQLLQSGKLRTMPQIVRDPHGVYGLIGVTTPELKTVVSRQVKLEGEEPQNFQDTAANVKAQVDWLQSHGVNKIIVLSHMGYELEKKLAATIPGIDIIVGGHSHDVVNGVTPGENLLNGPTGEPVLLLQGGKNADYLDVADVLFDPKGRVIPQQNQLFSPFILPADARALALRNSVLGTPVPIAYMAGNYDANGNEAHADPVAQFTADAMRKASNADIAFIRSSEIRNNYKSGEFTNQDLRALMPFSDPVVKLPLSGQEILTALTRSGKGMREKDNHPGMLHPSGMAVSFDRQTGQVRQAYVLDPATRQWQPLDPTKTYNVALGEFCVKNQEFPEFAHPERVTWNSGQPVRSFFHWGLQQAGAPNRPINIRDDGRLQIT
jgi:2',3'-cyclic-nucleotide 2'-phosphodiesterase (5'-nucleotidase family)